MTDTYARMTKIKDTFLGTYFPGGPVAIVSHIVDIWGRQSALLEKKEKYFLDLKKQAKIP